MDFQASWKLSLYDALDRTYSWCVCEKKSVLMLFKCQFVQPAYFLLFRSVALPTTSSLPSYHDGPEFWGVR